MSAIATHPAPNDPLRSLLPPEIIRRCGLELLQQDGSVLRLRAATPVRAEMIEEMTFLTGLVVEVEGPAAAPMAEVLADPPPSGVRTDPALRRLKSLEEPAANAGAAQRVDLLMRHAAALGASDIHVEPYETRVRVRFRLDGVLREVGDIPAPQRDAVAARIKVMAGLDIAEKRRPQDGRFRFHHDGRSIDVRVATLPTGYGEKVVLRLLDRSQVFLDLPAVGLAGEHLEAFCRAIDSPHGMVVVTGPTGCGKTTTLYAALATLNREDLNILTAEDPVEYDLPGVNQTRVRPDIGFSFADALRAFLRQDPDVVMVGEIRDRETADMAIRAALTGHLVLTTLHTNDAPTAVARLTDMGVAPYLVAASLRLVVAQRLVRRVCTECAGTAEILPDDRDRLGGQAPNTCRRGAGCPACNDTGYRGRTALFELMPVSEDLATVIVGGAAAGLLRETATAAGMRSLRCHGCDSIQAGLTTPSEVLRATA